MIDAFIGEVRVFAVQPRFAVEGWLQCDGKQHDISSYPDLFKIIGNRYGGDGKSTFCVPDLRERVPVGAGAGPGLTPYALGEQFGVSRVVLTREQMPSHGHLLATETGIPYNGMVANPHGATKSRLLVNPGGTTEKSFAPGPASPTDAVALHPESIESRGEGKPHPNYHPYLTMQYRIAWQGERPIA